MIGLAIGLALAAAPIGDWSVNDITDNDTGERKVEAVNVHITKEEYATIWMRCVGRQPMIFVEWDGLPTAKLMVFELSTPANPHRRVRFTMERSDDVVNRGMVFSDPISFVEKFGHEHVVTFTAHGNYGSASLEFPMDGTAAAWARVESNCETDV